MNDDAHDDAAYLEELARREREAREREYAEILRVAESGSAAEHRALAAAQLSGIKGFDWNPRCVIRRKP